jgi:hypothetical protein
MRGQLRDRRRLPRAEEAANHNVTRWKFHTLTKADLTTLSATGNHF